MDNEIGQLSRVDRGGRADTGVAAVTANRSARPHDAYPVRTVARLTGLSPDLIRAWEKRYGVVTPLRGPRGARLYTSEDITHLRLLARVVASGRAIGDVARLDQRQLEALASDSGEASMDQRQLWEGAATPQRVVADVLGAVVADFDSVRAERLLGDALLALGTGAFVRDVAAPLLHEAGERWSQGSLTVSDEHLLSGILRNLLSGMIRARGPCEDAQILLATPAGERHEFGLLLVALLFLDGGLGVRYLGVDLPANEIASAARRTGVAAVGLGIVNGENRPRALSEVRRLEDALPPGTELWLGGRDAAPVHRELGRSRSILLDQPQRAQNEMARLRERTATPERRGQQPKR
jgi:MerR family transcriptional regulator, light-induced transcriptional regulator